MAAATALGEVAAVEGKITRLRPSAKRARGGAFFFRNTPQLCFSTKLSRCLLPAPRDRQEHALRARCPH